MSSVNADSTILDNQGRLVTTRFDTTRGGNNHVPGKLGSLGNIDREIELLPLLRL